eukprot:gene2866-3561_t
MSALVFNSLFDYLYFQKYSYQNSSSEQQRQSEKAQVHSPPLDITETSDSFIINLELPGVFKDDISIEFKDNKLIIQANKNNNNLKNKKKSSGPSIEDIDDDKLLSNKRTISDGITEMKEKEIISERKFGKFKRIIDFSKKIQLINILSIKTTFINGLLEITIPKK